MLGTVLLLAGALAGTVADRLDSSDLAIQVRQLVRKLNSAELAQRQAAEESLMKLGLPVLELLPRERDLGNAEVAQRVGRIRQKLERARAALGAESSRVTLRGKLPLASIFTALEQQTGNKIAITRLDNSAGVLQGRFDVDFQQIPFWPALDRLLAQAGLDVYPYGEHSAIDVVTPAEPAPRGGYVSYAGPFRFQVVSLLAQRELKAPQTRSLKVELEIAWEPRLAPIHLKQRLAEVQAVDDHGNRLASETSAGALEVPVPRGPIAARLLLPLILPPREVRAIAELRGTLSALLPGQSEQFRFTELGRARTATQRIANVSITVEDSAKVGKSLEVRLLVHFDHAGDALASHRTWIFSNPVYLQTQDKKRITPESVKPTRQTADEVGLALVFPVDRAADEYTLVYQTPTTISTASLAYQFRDIPLP